MKSRTGTLKSDCEHKERTKRDEQTNERQREGGERERETEREKEGSRREEKRRVKCYRWIVRDNPIIQEHVGEKIYH